MDPTDFADTVFGLRHKALRNSLYHMARRAWLDGWNRIFNLATILGGTSTVANLTSGNDSVALLIGLIITFVGAFQLVMDFSGRARDHEFLQRRYHELMANIECQLNPSAQNCADWEAEMIRIAADEPPTMRALDAIADNQATSALIGSAKPRLRVTGWENFTRQILPHNKGVFPIQEDWEASPVLIQSST